LTQGWKQPPLANANFDNRVEGLFVESVEQL
jgi:hypothetical protein